MSDWRWWLPKKNRGGIDPVDIYGNPLWGDQSIQDVYGPPVPSNNQALTAHVPTARDVLGFTVNDPQYVQPVPDWAKLHAREPNANFAPNTPIRQAEPYEPFALAASMPFPTVTKGIVGLAKNERPDIKWYEPAFDIASAAGGSGAVLKGLGAAGKMIAPTAATVGTAGMTASNWDKSGTGGKAFNLAVTALSAYGLRGAAAEAFLRLPPETQDAILRAGQKPTLRPSQAMGITPEGMAPRQALLNEGDNPNLVTQQPKAEGIITPEETKQAFNNGPSESAAAKGALPTVPKIVQRIEESGKVSTVEKPQGIYTTPADKSSPHIYIGGERRIWNTNPNAKVLRVEPTEVLSNRGQVPAPAGIGALKHFLGGAELARLGGMRKSELIRKVSAKYPDIEWARYTDVHDVLDAYGGVLTKEKGYDAIWAPDLTDPAFSEYVALTDKAFEAIPAGQVRTTSPITPEVSNVPPLGTSGTGGRPSDNIEAQVAALRSRPPIPPIKPSTATGTPAPKEIPDAIARALSIGDAEVARDAPGLITRLMLKTPGLKQIRSGLQPGLTMPSHILRSYVAEGVARAEVGHTLGVNRMKQLQSLADNFGGAKVLAGEEKAPVRFVGTVEQAKYPFTGTLRDVIEYPELYDLTPQQRVLIDGIGVARDAAFGQVKDAYNLNVGQFPRRPGAVFLPNYEAGQTAEDMFGSIERAAASGRGKTRFYEGARERYAHSLEQHAKHPERPVFTPDTNMERLLEASDDASARMAGTSVYRTGAGGKTKLEVMQELDPELAAKMQALTKRLTSLKGTKGRLTEKQADAIDGFLSSPVEDADLTTLHADLAPTVTRGKNTGKGIGDIDKELRQIQAQIGALRTSWAVANITPYQRVQEAGNLLWKSDEAQVVKQLAEQSHNRFLKVIDSLRATAFGGDLSPISIQGSVAWLLDPIGASRSLATMAKQSGFTREGLLKDMTADPVGWQRFTEATGMNPLGHIEQEFSMGYLGKIPKFGPKWDAFNEAVYLPLKKIQKDIFTDSYKRAIAQGRTEYEAMAIAGDDATKIIPQLNSRRLGQSARQAAHYRAVVTSVSFLTQPTALMADAAKGFVKLGMGKAVNPTEQFAMRRVTTLFAATAAVSTASAMLYAETHNEDVGQAALNAVNPNSPKFFSLVLPNGARISLGGPMRSILKGIAPGTIQGMPVPVPFAHIDKFILGKMGPALRIVYDEARNQDYFGKKIRSGDFPVNILRGLAYAGEGVMPLTIGSSLQQLQGGETMGNVLQQAGSQFAGTNLTPFNAAYSAKQKWTNDLKDFNLIPVNDAERRAAKLPSREDYRQRNPDVDAKLFLGGDVSSLQSPAALKRVTELATQEHIDLRAVPGVKARMDQRSKEQAMGVKPSARTLVDVLVDQLTKPNSKPASPKATPVPTPTQNPSWRDNIRQMEKSRSSLTPQERAAFVMARPDYQSLSYMQKQALIRQAVAA